MQTDLGIQGAKRASFKEVSLRELAIRVIAENPGADRDQCRDLLVAAVKKNSDWTKHGIDDDYIDVCIHYACSNTINAMMSRKPIRREERTKVIKATREALATTMKTVVERRAQQIILDTIMPNGKPMREVTGTYLAKVNIGFAKIAKAAGKKKIGDVLDEKQARKLMK